LLAYSAAVFQNCGNYRAFGDSKFVPEIPPEDFKHALNRSECYKTHSEVIENIWARIEKEVYCEEEPFKILGFRDEKGTTSYYSSNVTSTDAKKVDEFCQATKISPLNTRLMKLGDNEYELRIASQLGCEKQTPYLKTYQYTLNESGEKITVHVKAADFSEIMSKVVQALE
jgi:dipeptidyl-peptidase-3